MPETTPKLATISFDDNGRPHLQTMTDHGLVDVDIASVDAVNVQCNPASCTVNNVCAKELSPRKPR